ncbi:MAG TPA: tetraacyldisaccharide 4'-kinase [Hyphomicrobiales bacterium]|nr:tetraacyldisaccharide 4'-kinase [Hyphomicrobiales bacterium]
MKAPDFWWRRDAAATALSFLLSPIAAIVGRVAGMRMLKAGATVPVPVVCVGNFIAGGAGKTPLAMALAELAIAELGRKPAFLTRGYRGRLRGPVLVDPERHSTADVGDEPLLLARIAPTIKSSDRVAGARLAVELGADLIIMDDGFQNASLEKDASIVVVDAGRGLGNGRVMPAGPLRAPLATQMRRASAVVVVGAGDAGSVAAQAAARRGKPVIRAEVAPVSPPDIADRRLVAFAGIGRPEKFFATVRGLGGKLIEAYGFADHHRFTDAEIGALAQVADRGLTPVTTEKDHLRLVEAGRLGKGFAERTLTVPVRLTFEDPRRAVTILEEAIAAAKPRAAH